MIIDHRTYNIHPGSMPAFLKIYGELGYPLQLKYLEYCVGWYVSMDIGPLNQVIHMWRFSDLNNRTERRQHMAVDPK